MPTRRASNGSRPTTPVSRPWASSALKHGDVVLVVCNFTPVPRHNMVLGVPGAGFWREMLNSDAAAYGGSGLGNLGGVEAQPVSWHGRPYTVSITAPPLAVVLFRRETPGEA